MTQSAASDPQLSLPMKLVILVIVSGLGFIAYTHWGTFVATTVEWQKSLHGMLANHIRAVSEDVFKYGGALIALSFAYGVFHAIGPGHGKAVIVTYLGTQKETLWKGIVISFAAALLQAFIAIGLVSVLARVLKFKLADVHNYGNEVAQASYLLVILLGGMLLIGAARRLLKHRASAHGTDHSHNHQRSHHHSHEHAHQHVHSSDCCSHTHVPEQGASAWQTLTVILSMGFRPCSGAIVVLIYAHLVGVYAYGVIATMMMGVGTGLSVSLIALTTLYARSWIERFASDSSIGDAHGQHVFSHYVRGIGGIILIALGGSLYHAASVLSAGHPLL